jgi:cytochrome c553
MAGSAAGAEDRLPAAIGIGGRHVLAVLGRRLAGAYEKQQWEYGMTSGQISPLRPRRCQGSEPTPLPAGSPFPMLWAKRWAFCAAVTAAASLVGACTGVDRTSTDRFVETGELIALSGGYAGAANACFTCHGLDGTGDGAGSPRLAARDMGYLVRQLEAYADGRRRHPQMGWIAEQLTPKHRHAVAAYYSAMNFEPLPMPDLEPPLLYVRGDPQRGLPACASCHGVQGEGIGPGNPPLGGQPAPYLAEQIVQWAKGRRRNDPGDVMLRISQRLAPSEIAALSAYAARLPGGPPSPESPEAFLSEHRVGPRNDVSEPLLHVPVSGRAAE